MYEYAIKLTWDDEAAVWVAVNDEIPLAMDDGSLDALIQRVRVAAPETLEMNGKEHTDIYLNFAVKRRAKAYA
jgi:hypothetical protein